MPIGATLAAAAVTGGVALYNGSQQQNAANNALNAQNQATQQQIAAQQQALQQITALQQPYINAGYGALGQLSSLYGYGASPTTAANTNTAPNPYATATGGPMASTGNNQVSAAPGGSAPTQVGGTGQASQAAPMSGQIRTSGGGAANPYTGGIPVTTPGTSGAPASPGTPDWSAYIAANPDVAAWIAQGHGDPSLGANQTPAQAAAYQYQNTGQSEGRQVSYVPGTATAATAGTPATTSANPADAALQAAIGPTPNYPTTFDGGTAPTQDSFFNNFQSSPGYQFQLDQTLRAANAGYAARGLLQSDAAAKGIMSQAQGLAAQDYQNWFNRQQTLYSDAANQFNNDRSANFNIFNTDRNFQQSAYDDNRNYATNRYDNTANNLFRTVSLGTGAAGAVSGANTSYANSASNIYGNQGTNAASAAYQTGAANSQTAGALGGALTSGINAFSNIYGGAGTPINVQSYSNPVAVQTPASAANQNLNFLPNYSGI